MSIDIHQGVSCLVGDIVRPTKTYLEQLQRQGIEPQPFKRDWTVWHNDGRLSLMYLRDKEHNETVIASRYLFIVEPVKEKPKWDGETPKKGQLVRILANADQVNPLFAEGQFGEIAYVGVDGAISIRQDHVGDAIQLKKDYFEIVHPECEEDMIWEARQKYGVDHVHQWQFKWEDTHRFCECGATQWNLRCWTGDQFQFKTPRGILIEREDLEREKYFGTKNFVPARPRPGEAFRVRSEAILAENTLFTPVTMIGVGGIGSFTMQGLMKMGLRHLTCYDPDNVDTANIGTQLYGSNYVGSSKVSALRDMLSDQGPRYRDGANFDMQRFQKRFEARDSVGQIVIMGVDSMAARKEIWEILKARRSQIRWVIDGRMGAENALLYVMNPNDAEDVTAYEKTLYTDEQAVQEPCTARGTVYTGQLIGGWICKAVKDVLMNKPNYPRITLWDIENNAMEVFTKPIRAVRTA